MKLSEAIRQACDKYGYPYRISPYTGLCCVGQRTNNSHRHSTKQGASPLGSEGYPSAGGCVRDKGALNVEVKSSLPLNTQRGKKWLKH
jgi:hypothetical protein